MHKSYLNFKFKFCLCQCWGILRMNGTFKIMIVSSLPHFADEEGEMFVFLSENVTTHCAMHAFAHRVKEGPPQCGTLHINIAPFSSS